MSVTHFTQTPYTLAFSPAGAFARNGNTGRLHVTTTSDRFWVDQPNWSEARRKHL